MMELLIGGLISVVSVVVALIVRHLLERRPDPRPYRLHAALALYDKQKEFLEKLAKLLTRIQFEYPLPGKNPVRGKSLSKSDKIRLEKEFLRVLVENDIYIPRELSTEVGNVFVKFVRRSAQPSDDESADLHESIASLRDAVAKLSVSDSLLSFRRDAMDTRHWRTSLLAEPSVMEIADRVHH